MHVKKYKGKVFGAELTNNEKKAMDIEIKKILAEQNKKHNAEIDAIILWTLHTHFGFGKKKLKEFYDNFVPALDDLTSRYEMVNNSEEEVWLCTHMLEEYGIDLKKWNEMRGN